MNDIGCDMCGAAITEKTRAISTTVDGLSYSFDSDTCLLTFQKFIELYGKGFFKSNRSL